MSEGYTRPVVAEGPIRLDLNEAPWDADGAFRQAFLAFLEQVELRRYPPMDAFPAREAAAKLYGWVPEGTLVGNGSNEMLAAALAAFGAGRKVLTLFPSFSVYPFLIARAGGNELRINFEAPGFEIPAAELLAAARDADVLLLCSPNNPTGGELSPELWRTLLELGKPTIWDGAYWEFGTSPDMGAWLSTYPHLMVTRTLSKVWGVAGVRAGCLCTSPATARTIAKKLLPFAPGVAVWAAFAAAASLPQVGQERAARIVAERERQLAAIAAIPNVEAVPSRGNFYLLRRRGWTGKRLAEVLARRGVAVRPVGELSARGYVRVSVGNPEEGDVLLSVLEEVSREHEGRSG